MSFAKTHGVVAFLSMDVNKDQLLLKLWDRHHLHLELDNPDADDDHDKKNEIRKAVLLFDFQDMNPDVIQEQLLETRSLKFIDDVDIVVHVPNEKPFFDQLIQEILPISESIAILGKSYIQAQLSVLLFLHLLVHELLINQKIKSISFVTHDGKKIVEIYPTNFDDLQSILTNTLKDRHYFHEIEQSEFFQMKIFLLQLEIFNAVVKLHEHLPLQSLRDDVNLVSRYHEVLTYFMKSVGDHSRNEAAFLDLLNRSPFHVKNK